MTGLWKFLFLCFFPGQNSDTFHTCAVAQQDNSNLFYLQLVKTPLISPACRTRSVMSSPPLQILNHLLTRFRCVKGHNESLKNSLGWDSVKNDLDVRLTGTLLTSLLFEGHSQGAELVGGLWGVCHHVALSGEEELDDTQLNRKICGKRGWTDEMLVKY